MTSYVALLRVVNVGGTGKLPMKDLVSLCKNIGLSNIQTYIASGDVVFKSSHSEEQIKAALEAALHAYAGKPVGVLVRTAGEMAEILADNPFPGAPANHTLAIFLDNPPSSDALKNASGLKAEKIHFGKREIYIHYTEGMGQSKLKIPASSMGTARNMNTVAKLTEMAKDL